MFLVLSLVHALLETSTWSQSYLSWEEQPSHKVPAETREKQGWSGDPFTTAFPCLDTLWQDPPNGLRTCYICPTLITAFPGNCDLRCIQKQTGTERLCLVPSETNAELLRSELQKHSLCVTKPIRHTWETRIYTHKTDSWNNTKKNPKEMWFGQLSSITEQRLTGRGSFTGSLLGEV